MRSFSKEPLLLPEENMRSTIQDWRQAITMPTAYRVGNSTLRLQTHFVAAVVVVGIACLVLLYTLLPINYKSRSPLISDLNAHDEFHHHNILPQKYVDPSMETKCQSKEIRQYNLTYPLTKPEITSTGAVKYRIGIISDLDTASKVAGETDTWISYFKRGWLIINVEKKKVQIQWDKEQISLKASLALGGRGMELSELVVFDGRLLTIDDRTGTVYEILNDRVAPWVILSDGNGKNTKGFKGEWATVKDHRLYIGGLGKEWTNSAGEILNYDPQWIKEISPAGEVKHKEWRDVYLSLMTKAGIKKPGYMIHESVCWSNYHQEWFFLPRRASNLKYNDKDDEKRGTNILLRASEDFKTINALTVGPLLPTHGFSSFKFVPNLDDRVIIALKSEENDNRVATFITVFTITGEVWFPELEIGDFKYEGIEFI